MILLSILLYKSCIWEIFYSWVIFRKVVDKADCKILWSHISPDGMTGSSWYFACWQITWRRKISNKFFTGYDAQRFLKCCSVTGNSIEWKIKCKEKTFHAFLIHNLSQQVILPNQIAVFIDQLEIYKNHCFLFLHVGR